MLNRLKELLTSWFSSERVDIPSDAELDLLTADLRAARREAALKTDSHFYGCIKGCGSTGNGGCNV